MTQNELQVLVDDLAMRTGVPTVLEDHEQRMIVYSAQDGPIDEVQLTGADLHDGNDRLAFHLGFKLSRLTGRYPAALECHAGRPRAAG